MVTFTSMLVLIMLMLIVGVDVDDAVDVVVDADEGVGVECVVEVDDVACMYAFVDGAVYVCV